MHNHQRPARRHDVLTVVLNWNGAAMTVDCVRDLRATGDEADILVVDNGSSEPRSRMLALETAEFGVPVHYLTDNLGFAGGMNAALRWASTAGHRYAWLLNNDLTVQRGALAALMEAMGRFGGQALVTPRIVEPTGRDQHVGGVYHWDGRGVEALAAGEFPSAGPDRWLTAAALLVPVEPVLGLGAFCDDYFAYCEDVDLSVLAARRGFTLGVVPEAQVIHAASASSGGAGAPFSEYMQTRNEWLFVRRCSERSHRRQVLRRVAARQLRSAAVARHRGDIERSRALLAGLVRGARGEVGRPASVSVSGGAWDLVLRRPWRLANVIEGRPRAAAGA